jgi:hypothetical protein
MVGVYYGVYYGKFDAGCRGCCMFFAIAMYGFTNLFV